MKTLNQLIEEEIEKAKEILYGECPDFHDPNTHQNYPSEWVQKMIKVEDFDRILSQSLHRIAKITAEEIVPEKKEKTKFQNDMYDALDDGFNQAISDLQTKIKEFGI